MKRQLLGVAAFMLALSAHAQDNPLWMRYCAISPDGTSIAFTYKGDIYTVPVNGGKAAQRTTLIRCGAPMENKSHLLPTAWAVWIYSW